MSPTLPEAQLFFPFFILPARPLAAFCSVSSTVEQQEQPSGTLVNSTCAKWTHGAAANQLPRLFVYKQDPVCPAAFKWAPQ
ncbi:hypothetical protein EYF80_038484 [Liparis tanakae]|uniref:Uncharacterized protein n=1 Tax=Liparis tanakae TaxID=230148 RepID=A0A4Z2GDI3_9TELE|nr:hypothetical protein EYF80_038484 [Liparis tanakae]